eukprot:7808700-Lingulodinium_polyedra.AAC.1
MEGAGVVEAAPQEPLKQELEHGRSQQEEEEVAGDFDDFKGTSVQSHYLDLLGPSCARLIRSGEVGCDQISYLRVRVRRTTRALYANS